MIVTEGKTSVRFLCWFPLSWFVALLVTMATVNILPSQRHLAYAVVEWAEMLIGTLSAVIAFVVAFLGPRFRSPVIQGGSRYKLIATCGLGIWGIFWLIALLSRPWAD